MSRTKKRNAAMIVITLVFLGIFFGSYSQYQVAAVPSMVYSAYGLTDAQFSSIMTAPLIPALFLSIVLGVLVDKYGVKQIVSVCMVISAIGLFIRVFATNYTMVFLGMALAGFSIAVLNANLAKITATLFPMEKVGGVIGIIMGGSTGAMAVAYGTTALFPSLELLFWVTAIICAIITVLWLVLVRKSDFQGVSSGVVESVPIKEALGVSLKSKNVWLLGLTMLTMLGGAMVIANFQVAYLTAYKGYTEISAGSFGTVLMIGSIIGSVSFPMIIAKSKRPALILLIAGLIAGGAAVAMVEGAAWSIYLASFLNGALRSGMISIMVSLTVMFPEIGPKYAGTASGMASTMMNLGSIIIPTYIVIPLAGGNMMMYFYLAGVSIAISAILLFVLTRKMNLGTNV